MTGRIIELPLHYLTSSGTTAMMAWTALGDEILCPKQSEAKTVITVTAFTTPLSIAISCADSRVQYCTLYTHCFLLLPQHHPL